MGTTRWVDAGGPEGASGGPARRALPRVTAPRGPVPPPRSRDEGRHVDGVPVRALVLRENTAAGAAPAVPGPREGRRARRRRRGVPDPFAAHRSSRLSATTAAVVLAGTAAGVVGTAGMPGGVVAGPTTTDGDVTLVPWSTHQGLPLEPGASTALVVGVAAALHPVTVSAALGLGDPVGPATPPGATAPAPAAPTPGPPMPAAPTTTTIPATPIPAAPILPAAVPSATSPTPTPATSSPAPSTSSPAPSTSSPAPSVPAPATPSSPVAVDTAPGVTPPGATAPGDATPASAVSSPVPAPATDPVPSAPPVGAAPGPA